MIGGGVGVREQAWIERVAEIPVDGSNQRPDVCLIEVRAWREMRVRGGVASKGLRGLADRSK